MTRFPNLKRRWPKSSQIIILLSPFKLAFQVSTSPWTSIKPSTCRLWGPKSFFCWWNLPQNVSLRCGRYVPVKKYEIFDGVTFQWFMCGGIMMVPWLAWKLLGLSWCKCQENPPVQQLVSPEFMGISWTVSVNLRVWKNSQQSILVHQKIGDL